MKTSHYHDLKKKWLKKHKALHKKLVTAHKDVLNLLPKQHIIGSLMLASTPFLSVAPVVSAMSVQQPIVHQAPAQHVSKAALIETLKKELPADVQPLTSEQEDTVAATLSANFHMKVAPELQGIRLNRSYGLIGKEQHLPRYPGDSVEDHLDQTSETPASDGITPGLGAWGYFAPSREQMTQQDVLREKYYIAVPTFLAPGWNENVGKYGLFFKYRKMLVVNPENGKAIVCDIGDAGPAEWTGKHLGGSPEVMHYLERVDGAQRGPVLYYFIDDPHDTIPLGPANL